MSDDDRRQVLEGLNRHLPADDPLKNQPEDTNFAGKWQREPENGAWVLVIALPDSEERLYAIDDGEKDAAVLNVTDVTGGSVTLAYRDGEQIERHRYGGPSDN
jgi:hypothetical protein